ncbi:MAG: class I SAM-dependent methyltransferase [Tenuifilaceae bacterium]
MKAKLLIMLFLILFFKSVERINAQSSINQSKNLPTNNGQKLEDTLVRGFLPKEYEKYDHIHRDRIEKPDEIIEYIGIKPGMKIGEAGAGRGYFTFHLSKKVEKEGIIYANDISERDLLGLAFYAKEFGIDSNIVTILGKVDDPLFPVNDLDMIVIYKSFHDFEKKTEWLINAKKYLKQSGRLVIIDRYNPDHTDATYWKVNRIARRANYHLLFHKKLFFHIQVFVLN